VSEPPVGWPGCQIASKVKCAEPKIVLEVDNPGGWDDRTLFVLNFTPTERTSTRRGNAPIMLPTDARPAPAETSAGCGSVPQYILGFFLVLLGGEQDSVTLRSCADNIPKKFIIKYGVCPQCHFWILKLQAIVIHRKFG
jgi:hypothetical protein